MTVFVILFCAAGLFGLIVPAAVTARSRIGVPLVYGLSFAICAVGLVAALARLLGDPTTATTVVLPLGLPWLGAHFRVDALSAFFLIVVDLGGAMASLYGLGYGRHEAEPQRVLPFYPAFLAAMNLVCIADDAFSFLASWELMSLASWALVMAHHRERDNARAGYIYLVMASAGTLALLLAFGLLAGPGGGYDFASIRVASQSPLMIGGVLALILFGAGSKAGLVPLHVWLPLAHPAAPSHVSALMSGVMTKVAIYAFVRVVFDLLGLSGPYSSMAVLALGAITAVMGILYAVLQTDLKKFLAYSTVENVGVIFVGLGLALGFRANGMTGAAALAMTAALFHVFNHSLFKSLLFFGAGAVLTATGARDMDRLGGLIHKMPSTSLAFLIGAMAIAALPPLNGFVSEWLTFQAVLLSPDLSQWGLKILVPAAGAMLALAAALAGAAFVRAFGITFLGRPRSPAAADAKEVDAYSLAAMAAVACLCLAAGIFPGLVIDALSPVTEALVGAHMPLQISQPWLSIAPIAEARSSYNGLLVLGFIAISAGLAAFAIHRLASRALRRAPAWDCGFPEPSPLTQYSAASFAQPLRRVFATSLFLARERVDMPAPGDLRAARITVDVRDLAWDLLYARLAAIVGVVADRLNAFQFLTIRQYLSLVFVALVSLLTVLALWT